MLMKKPKEPHFNPTSVSFVCLKKESSLALKQSWFLLLKSKSPDDHESLMSAGKTAKEKPLLPPHEQRTPQDRP